MKKAIYVDWLSIQYLGEPVSKGFWRFVDKGYGCKEFQKVYQVYYQGELFGSYSYAPNLPSLPGNFGLLKLENSELYAESLAERLFAFRHDLGFIYKGLSRVDVCADFNFLAGRKSPEVLIRRIMSGELDCLNKMRCQAVRGAKGEDPWESVIFGSRSSAVRVCMYNKSKEMQEKHFKTWIKEADIRNGVDWEKDVWRLEFSLKSECKKWLDKETGEEVELSLENLLQGEWLKKFFNSLRRKYFSFVPHSLSANRYRQKKVQIWDEDGDSVKRLKERRTEDVTRADRIFIKKLWWELEDPKQRGGQDRPVLCEWAIEWANRRSLRGYAEARAPRPVW